MSKGRVFATVLLLICAAICGIIPFRFANVLPIRRGPGPDGQFAIKYDAGDRIPIVITGALSINGWRAVRGATALLLVPEGPDQIDVPIDVSTSEKDWNDTITIDRRFVSSPASVSMLVGPLPSDPRLVGRSAQLVVRVQLTVPVALDQPTTDHSRDGLFEEREAMATFNDTVTFYAAGEKQREQESKKADAEETRTFFEQLKNRRLKYWLAAAGLGLTAIGVLAVPLDRGRSRNGSL